MSTLETVSPMQQPSWWARTEQWLDDRGKFAWIGTMIVGFIVFWPVGLALLAYMIWSKRMFGTCHKSRTVGRKMYRATSSGNSAFDAYKADTLQRLEHEQEAFESFLNRLREAKDKTEFDLFMQERSATATSSETDNK